MKKIITVVCIIVTFLLAWDYYNFKQEGQSLTQGGITPIQLNSVTSATLSDEGLTVVCDSTNDAFLTLPLLTKNLFWKRLEIDFKQLDGIKAVEIFYKEIDDKGFSKQSKKYVSSWKEDSFTWYLPPGEYGELRIDFDGYQTETKPIIHDIRVKEFSIFFSCELYLYPLALFILVMVILPGSLIYVLTARNTSDAPRNHLLYFFCNSLIFYFLLYLVEIAAIKTGIPTTTTVTIALTVLLAGMVAAIKIRKRSSLLRSVFRKEKKAFITVAILVLVSCLFATKFSEAPFTYSSVNHNTLDRLTIFSKFSGHDNKFQYVNGKAIADDEPFSKYYSQGRLIYKVQDRGMFPGVIYSVFRTFFTTFSTYIGDSYLTYTLVGLCMNVMVLLPLIVLFRRYFPPKYQNPFVLVLCLNPFVFANLYFTWFKFSGAALFISGILILLYSRKEIGNWIIAGFMFGLASSMHAGNALAIPPMFLWFMGLSIYEFGFWSRQVFIFPIILSTMFVLVNLPWSIVKALNFPDNHALLIQHYFPAKQGATLGATIKNFFDTHSLKTQLSFRFGNIVEGLRFGEFSKAFSVLSQKETTQFVRDYNNYQFFFVMFSIVPLVCIGVIGQLFSYIYSTFKKTLISSATINKALRYEAVTFFSLSFLTIAGLVFIAYTNYPDLNHALPAGPILIVHTLLIGWILQTGRLGHVLLGAYALFSAWRMIVHASEFIFI